MSKETRKGGKEAGKILVAHKIDLGVIGGTSFVPLDCGKPAFRHLQSRGVSFHSMHGRGRAAVLDVESEK